MEEDNPSETLRKLLQRRKELVERLVEKGKVNAEARRELLNVDMEVFRLEVIEKVRSHPVK